MGVDGLRCVKGQDRKENGSTQVMSNPLVTLTIYLVKLLA